MKKSIKLLMLLVAIFAVSCNKDDDQGYVPNPNLLATPATLENESQLAITDGTGGGCGNEVVAHPVENTIVIDKEGTIVDPSKVTIELNLVHSWCGDLVVELIAPDGGSCTLIKRLGSISDTSCGVNANFIAGNIFRFNAAFQNQINVTGLVSTDNVPGGDYAPSVGASTFPSAAVMVNLQTFLTGKNIKGTWKLRVADYGQGDSGTVNGWKLKFDPGSIL
jgi:subtilisin-like proprotein convertase family protein